MKLVHKSSGEIVEAIQFDENIDEINDWLRSYDITPTWILVRTQPHNEWNVHLGLVENTTPWRIYSKCWLLRFKDSHYFRVETYQHILLYYNLLTIPKPQPETEMWDFIKI